jgi:hypothetical protein
MSNMKEIPAGYLWVGQWTGPGFPIYPKHWSEKLEEGSNELVHQYYLTNKKIMEKNPPDEVLKIKTGAYKIKVTYPLSTPYEMEILIGKNGITRQRLMDLCAEAYHSVYRFVNEGIYKNGINETYEAWNKYGIWGHFIGDLTIHTFYVNEETNVITLGVDS